MATEKMLVKTAQELNELMGLKPAIKLKAGVEELTKGIKAAMKHITPEDEFSDAIQAVLDELAAPASKAPAKAAAPAKGKKVAPAPEPEEEEEEEEVEEEEVEEEEVEEEEEAEEEEEEAEEEEEKPAKKGKGKVAAVPAKGKPAEEEKPAKKKGFPQKDPNAMDRTEVIAQSIKELCKKGATLQDIIKRGDEIYGKKVSTKNVNRYALNALVKFDVLKKVGDVYKFV